MNAEKVIEGGIDLDAIGRKYEVKGFFARLGTMFSGLGRPKGTREYKEARIELQRLAAPLFAVLSVSMFVIVLVVVTAIQSEPKDVIEIRVAELPVDPEWKQENDPEPDDPEPQIMDEVEIHIDTPLPGPVVVDPAPVPAPAAPISVKPALQDAVQHVDSPVQMKSVRSSRTPGTIGTMTCGGPGYGSAMTEETVLKVLWWLKATQGTDGGWGGGSSKLANTALAMLTFLAHGEYPGSLSPYRKDFGPVVELGVQHLIACFEENGADGVPRMRGADGNEYAFLIATYALCEAYAMTRNPYCKEVAVKALSRIVKGQSPTGGWDYKINPKSTRDDLSFAGWALQALKAGKMAGLHPDGLDECINKAIKCLKTRCFHNDHFTYCANARQHCGLTATGCLAMQLLGYMNESEVRKALDYMREWHPTFKPGAAVADGGLGDNVARDCPSPQYYCYYATQCKYQAGMRQGAAKQDETSWHKWNQEMQKLYTGQIKDLPGKVKDWAGKEHKQGYFENKDSWSSRPVMDSCLAALQLMVYYRYLPTNQLKATAVDSAASGAVAQNGGDDVIVAVDF